MASPSTLISHINIESAAEVEIVTEVTITINGEISGWIEDPDIMI